MGHAPSIDAEEQDGANTASAATKEAPEKPSKSSKGPSFSFFPRKKFQMELLYQFDNVLDNLFDDLDFT